MKTHILMAAFAAFALSACSSAPTQAYPLPYNYSVPQANGAYPSVQNPYSQGTYGQGAYAQGNGYVQTQPNAYATPYAPQPQHYYQGLPQSITEQIAKLYPGAYVVDIDYEPYGYEVDLNNRMQLHFDTRGNLLGQKWD